MEEKERAFEVINILGVPYRLKFVDFISKEELRIGEIDYLNQEILILSGMAREVQYITILHEVMHGILEQLGFEESQEEHLIQGLANGLFQVLHENELFKRI